MNADHRFTGTLKMAYRLSAYLSFTTARKLARHLGIDIDQNEDDDINWDSELRPFKHWPYATGRFISRLHVHFLLPSHLRAWTVVTAERAKGEEGLTI
ncbi:hypothetical protein SERLA73DRAFT_183694, partial [Serpula lacrymans var. lacrymans S7.3]